jgi:hypothetical protein
VGIRSHHSAGDRSAFYGRYVDDVLLVLNDPKGWKTDRDVWDHLITRSNGLLSRDVERYDGNEDPVIRLRQEGFDESDLVFAGNKQKVFLLEGSSGLLHLQTIKRTVAVRSSEWRMLPDLLEEMGEHSQDFIESRDDWSEDADHLRKSDAVRDYVISAETLATYAPYVPRLFGLAVAANDWLAVKLLSAVSQGCIRRATAEFHVATPTKRSHFLGSTSIVLMPVQLRPVDQVPAHEGDLRAALIACLEHHGVSIPDATPLDALEVLFQRHARALSAVSGTGDGLLRRMLSRLGLPARKS